MTLSEAELCEHGEFPADCDASPCDFRDNPPSEAVTHAVRLVSEGYEKRLAAQNTAWDSLVDHHEAETAALQATIDAQARELEEARKVIAAVDAVLARWEGPMPEPANAVEAGMRRAIQECAKELRLAAYDRAVGGA